MYSTQDPNAVCVPSMCFSERISILIYKRKHCVLLLRVYIKISGLLPISLQQSFQN